MSKRIAVAILILLIAGSACVFAYDKEIRYQDIEWGSSLEEVKKGLSKSGFYGTYEAKESLPSSWADFDPYSVGLYWDVDGYIVKYESYWPGAREQSIAGHKLSYWQASFCKGSEEEWQFYMMEFRLAFDAITADSKYLEAYQDLKTKLSSIYGEGNSVENFKTLSYDESGYTYDYYTEWNGANGTGIRLVFSIYTNKRTKNVSRTAIVRLYYGQTDDRLLKDALAYITNKKAEDEAKAKEELSKNYSGL